MKRIAVIGCAGSGKTTLAGSLETLLRLPVIHLDRYYWKPGWRETPLAEWGEIQDELCDRPEWIMDGNYSSTMYSRMSSCDTAIFLDFPRWLCLWRVLRRYWKHRGGRRADMAEHCPERLTWNFLKWIWTFSRERRPGILRRLELFRGEKNVVILSSSGEIHRFLENFTRAGIFEAEEKCDFKSTPA